MAGDWIKIEHTMPDKPEVSQLAELLGIDHDAVVGKLVRFWVWADSQSIDGNAIHVAQPFLDRLTNCPGFAAGLLQVGWLESRNGRFSVPHFDRHNGQTAKSRALTRDRVKRLRERTDDSVTQTVLEKRREELDKPPPPIIPPVVPKLAGGGIVWSEEDVRLATVALEGTGYKRISDLIAERQRGGFLAAEVVVVCQEFVANSSKFKHPGAIADRLRSGVWPVEGVFPVAAGNGHRKPARSKPVALESLRMRLIKIDNEARNWNEDKVVAKAKEYGWA